MVLFAAQDAIFNTPLWGDLCVFLKSPLIPPVQRTMLPPAAVPSDKPEIKKNKITQRQQNAERLSPSSPIPNTHARMHAHAL